jgi:hypothetical protein
VEVSGGVDREEIVLEVADRVALEPRDPCREEEVDLLMDGLDARVGREGVDELAGEAFLGQFLRKSANGAVKSS